MQFSIEKRMSLPGLFGPALPVTPFLVPACRGVSDPPEPPTGGGTYLLSYPQFETAVDPMLLPNGRIAYPRWERFGTFIRFPLFATNPDGSGTFHMFGPHNRNFFHPQVTPDGRIIAIESTMVNEDAGPIAVLKLEQGPADPSLGGTELHWDRLTVNVNTDGEPWPYGIDAVLGAGTRAGSGVHPSGAYALTPAQQRLFNLWALLGAQHT